MPVEVELRFLHVDVAHIEARLVEERATFLSRVLLREVRFAGLSDNPGEFLRVRDDGRRVRLQHKAHSGDGASATETEILTEDYDAAVTFFEGIGLRRQRPIERVRTQYALGRAILSIDKFPGIPPHIEVESETLEDVLAACVRIGLDPAAHFDGHIGDIYRARGAGHLLGAGLRFSEEERQTLPTPSWGTVAAGVDP